MARPLVHHRTPEFSRLLADSSRRLGPIFGTSRPVHLLASSGTGALEAAVVNLIAEGETVLTVEAGKFGQRWGELCDAYEVPRVAYEVEWGRAPRVDELERLLAKNSEIQVVCLTHSETSTGVLVDLEAMTGVAKRHGCRVIVDCVTSACAHPIHMDAWGVDAVVSGSQKGFMLPPGLAMIALSEAAEAVLPRAKARCYYFDLRAAISALAKASTPFTPAISLVVGLAEALDMIEEEGLDRVQARHARLAAAARAAVGALGVSLFAEVPSNIVTVMTVPDGIDGDRVRKELDARFGVKIAGGQARLKGRILRLGHLGAYRATDLLGAIAALERVLRDEGLPAVAGAAVGAASEHFAAAPAVETAHR
jgi:aspartate aminotransferase-like enzyme